MSYAGDGWNKMDKKKKQKDFIDIPQNYFFFFFYTDQLQVNMC